MTDERLESLIDRHLNGVIDDLEAAELGARLLHSAADRERFWALAEMHALLHEHGQRRAGAMSDHEPAPESRGEQQNVPNRRVKADIRNAWFWRAPWVAVTVGLVVFFSVRR